MKTKKSISLVIANPNFSFNNSNSAVANFLNIILTTLEKNGYLISTYPKPVVRNAGPERKYQQLKRMVRFFLPRFFFNKKFNNYFNQVDQLNRSVSEQVKSSDLVLEFNVFGSEVGFLSKKIGRIKHVVIFDAPLSLQFKEMYGKTGKFHDRIQQSELNNLNSADKIVCYSQAVKSYLMEEFDLSENKIHVIPCIAWKYPVKRAVTKNELIIGFIGSFLSWHKVELLLIAFEKIAAELPETRLFLIGYGQEWNQIKLKVEKHPYKDRIFMPGFVSEEELDRIKSEIAIGVMPGSNWYGSPLKLFEYAESGIPVIAPETPTVLDYFQHNVNALIIDKNNELNSLVEHLKSLIFDSGLRDRLSLAGQKMMNGNLSKESVMTKFVNLVNSMVEDAK